MPKMAGTLAKFEPQPVLEGPTLLLRPMQAADKNDLAAAASDPLIWAGHPATERWRPEVFGPYFEALLAHGESLVAIDRASAQIIGTSRFYTTDDDPGTPSIGYTFLARSHWGGGTNFEMKSLMFAHAFRWSNVIWLHIDPVNIRSQTATGRLGAVHTHDAMLDFGAGPGLRQCWKLTQAAWQAVRARRA
ncbi:GNAT family N-acetyltransferase [Oceanicola sp. 502str15]|uniref:GNAT family N-acetyltransferase n=1 Tax=Oceanicola sp. 502str15 TaxID=2696061 RepID=UPI0020955AB0|nr:GNAT family N-acetyltransferase [Oceanicola sp. 502str15]MCO6384242.1 GNAT family N-acetyltransferase [Oceanicola sp. 502str15]